MAAKRIYQIAKEFERDEKEIIEFLTGQGIKVGNRLSAVTDETYNMLKAKFTAPPEPPPAPEPPPPPPESETPAQAPAETSAAPGEQAPAQGGGKKKRKRGRGGFQPFQGDPSVSFDPTNQGSEPFMPPSADVESFNKATRDVYTEAVIAGNSFIENYRYGGIGKKEFKAQAPRLSPYMDVWSVLCENKFDNADSSSVRYWQAVNKVTTKAFRLINNFGMGNREILADMRNTLNPVGAKYEPREIFTEEENQLFEEQQKFIFRAFGHGMGAVNDRLYDLKMYAERMKAKFDQMDFVEFATNPADELRSPNRLPFIEIAEAVNYSISGIIRRFFFYKENKDRIVAIINNFFEWLDGYAKLKEQGADPAKIEKYLELEKKFFALVEFMSFDNLLTSKKNKPKPFETALALINEYRDNMDDPDAERNFKYRVRGITNVIYKPKEFVFLYYFAGLEPQKDYRPLEDISTAADEAEAKENPADNADEA